MMKQTLNAGCGSNDWGNIRIDIQQFSDVFYRCKTTANVLASVEYLPFKNNIFITTKCYHTLEHIGNPRLAIRELKRVTNNKVIIRVPIWHVYSLMIEAITLFKSFFLIPIIGINYFMDSLYKVRRWRKRYREHKWYIKFQQTRINRAYRFIPQEYESEYLKD